MRLTPTLFLLAAVALLPESAAAQRVLISTSGPGVVPATDLVDVPTGRVTRLTDDPTDRALFILDGSVLIRRVSGERRWRARFLASGTDVMLPDGFGPPAQSIESFLAHPRQPMLFGIYRDGMALPQVARVDVRGLVVWQPCGAVGANTFDLSPDGRVLYVLCRAESTASVVAVDTESGTAVRSIPVDAALGNATSIVVGPDGTEFLTLRLANTPAGMELVRADLASGQRRAAVPIQLVAGLGPWLVPNPQRRDRPLFGRCLGNVNPFATCTTAVVDYQTLAIGPLVQSSGPYPMASFSAAGEHAVLSSVAVVTRVDLVTGAMLDTLPAPANGWVIAAWGAEPQAPTLSPPAVAVSAVSLAWALPQESTAVTTYRLEAGTQPGLANLVVADVGPAPSFFASGVPPGRYHVRIRAVNANGVSGPSNDVVVDVP